MNGGSRKTPSFHSKLLRRRLHRVKRRKVLRGGTYDEDLDDLVDSIVPQGDRFAPLENAEDAVRYEELKAEIEAHEEVGRNDLIEWLYNFIVDMRRRPVSEHKIPAEVWRHINNVSPRCLVGVPEWLKRSLLERYTGKAYDESAHADEDYIEPAAVRDRHAPLPNAQDEQLFERLRAVCETQCEQSKITRDEYDVLTDWLREFIQFVRQHHPSVDFTRTKFPLYESVGFGIALLSVKRNVCVPVWLKEYLMDYYCEP